MPEKVKMSQEMYDLMLQHSGLGCFEMSDRDTACRILADLDYEAQLIAISALLRRNDQADAEIERQIKEVDDYARRTSGWRNLVYPALNRILDPLFDRDVFPRSDFLSFSSSAAGMPMNSVDMRFTPHYLRH